MSMKNGKSIQSNNLKLENIIQFNKFPLYLQHDNNIII